MKERRQAPRAKVNVPVTWQRNRTRRSGNIVSLSRIGCFVLSGGRVTAREVLHLEIKLSNTEVVTAQCEVVEAAYEIGFAVKFVSLEMSDLHRLDRFLGECFHKLRRAKS
jgi:hypothetical protein